MSNRVVMAFGTFDFLHAGHLHYLQEAKKAAGENAMLVVVVSSDKIAEQEKGYAPVNPEKGRAELVKALGIVDDVVVGSAEPEKRLAVVKKYKPAVLVLGYDAREDEMELLEILRAKKVTPLPKVVRAAGYKTEINKSSELKKMLPLV